MTTLFILWDRTNGHERYQSFNNEVWSEMYCRHGLLLPMIQPGSKCCSSGTLDPAAPAPGSQHSNLGVPDRRRPSTTNNPESAGTDVMQNCNRRRILSSSSPLARRNINWPKDSTTYYLLTTLLRYHHASLLSVPLGGISCRRLCPQALCWCSSSNSFQEYPQ